MKTPPSMQALVDASRLNLEAGQGGKIDCPKCGHLMSVYRTPSGKLMGNCECGLTIPKG